MFCPFCGDQITGTECAKPACSERMATATATLAAVAAPPPPPATVVTAAPEPVLAPPPAPITGASSPPPRVVDASVEQLMTARARLWADMDATAALATKIEDAAKAQAGAPAAGLAAHARLTAGLDLVTELRAIEGAVAAETQTISTLEQNISANEAEIARLRRNRMRMIGAIAVGVLLVIILIATML